MPTIIPVTPADPVQRISIALDDEVYVLRFRWNSRDNLDAGSWYLDAWERDGTTAIAFGIKLVLGVFLGRNTDHPLFNAGVFLIDESGTGVEAGFTDLGGRIVVMHMTSSDRFLAGMPA